MKKKITKILIAIAVILVVLVAFKIFNRSEATSLIDLVRTSYDEAINYNVNDEFSASNGLSADGETGDGNFACFHSSALDTGTGNLKIVAKIMVDADGTMNGNGSYKTAGKMIAYYGAVMQGQRVSPYYTTVAQLLAIYQNGCNSVAGVDIPSGTYLNSSGDVYTAAQTYAASTEEKYVAVVFVLAGSGGIQDRVVVMSKEGAPKPQAEITKYIDSVNTTHYKGTVGSARAAYKANEGWKSSNPVEVEKDAVITYKITIKNVGSCELKGTFTDTYDSGLTFDSADATTTGESITLAEGASKTITVKLKATGSSYTTKYENKASFKYEDRDETITSSDYNKILKPKAKITKYIKNISGTYEGIIGSSRASHKADDGWKSSNPPKVAVDAVITYEITVKNDENCKLSGNFMDSCPSGTTFQSATCGSDTVTITGTGYHFTLNEKDDEKTFIVKVKATGMAVGGTYINTGKFKYSDRNETIESKDYFKPLTEDIKINKYITSADGTAQSRSTLTEAQKMASPVDVGKSDTSHVINYNIEITNKSDHSITGLFTDTHDAELEEGSFSTASGSNVTIASGATVTITCTLNLKVGAASGDYINTAKFKWTSAVFGEVELESSDVVTVEKEITITSTGSVKKYISKVNSTAVSGRDTKSLTDKDGNPVEVEKGDTVTYTIEIHNQVWYQNRSGRNYCNNSGNDSDRRCASHYNKHDLDWIRCKDTFEAGLAYKSHSGATLVDSEGNPVSSPTGNEIYFKWSNVAYDDTVKVDVTLTVTSSNMKKMNLENKVDTVRYQFSWYTCYISHYYYYCGAVDCGGHHRPSSCSWSHPNSAVNEDHPRTIDGYNYDGKIAGEDKDYVRLLDPIVSGVVWLETTKDGYKRDGESIANMTRDEQKNVKVELWRTGTGGDTLIATQAVNTTTGAFTFGRVKKGPNHTGTVPDWNISTGLSFKYNDDTLYNYYLVYKYDGERYEATTNLDKTNLDTTDHYKMKTDFDVDSNAAENATERTTFNNSLETISNNKAYAGTTNAATAKDLAYIVLNPADSLQQSILRWDGNLSTTTTANVTMKATSFTFYFTGGVNGDDTNYLKYINLGLVERERPDLSITKDVVSADVTINNHITTYTYDSLGTSPYTATSHNILSEAYLLRIYREDYEYRTSKYDDTVKAVLNANNRYNDLGRDNDLHVILTYKIKVKNESPTVKAKIREIIDYSSTDMTFLDAKVSGTALTSSAASSFSNSAYSGTTYNQNFLTGDALSNVSLDPNGTVEIIVRYRILKDTNGYLLIDTDSEGVEDGKANIAEIGAYSLYNGTAAAGLVDKDSNPGNVEFDATSGKADTTKFEDDTFETGIVVALKPTPPPPPPPPGPKYEKYCYRNISGIVFEDVDKSLTVDGQKISDGSKATSDPGAANVIVKLYEVVQKKNATSGDIEEEYYVDTGMWYRTGSDGRYYFGDITQKLDATTNKPANDASTEESTDDCYYLHPALYVVRFIYGDESSKLVTTDGNNIKYSGQDYQSTKYYEVGTAGTEDEILKPSAFTTASGNTTPFDSSNQPTLGTNIYSVARDNEVRRLEVNEYSTTTTYLMDTVLKARQSSDEAKLLASHTSMFADTKIFDLDVEYWDNYTVQSTFTIDGKVKTISNYYYSVRDINFGIAQRPQAKLQLMNDITEVKAITSDGETLIDILFDVEYTKEVDASGNLSIKHTTSVNSASTGLDNVQVLNRNGNNQGFRYVNVDTDILQGMTILVKFRVAVANTSEVDHLASWLEDKIKAENTVELNVEYNGTAGETRIDYGTDDKEVTDLIHSQKRKYNYEGSYLYKLLYSGDSSKSITSLRNTNTGTHVYNSVTGVGSDSVKKAYSYTNIKKKAQSDYKIGYYLGNIYYNAVATASPGTPEAKVETRVDQYIDYVDNDLIFKPEENINADDQITYLTYTTAEIAKKGLLRDIDPTVTSITDGQKDYYNSASTNTHNNLAFNIESAAINADFYKFLHPLTTTGAVDKLYNIDLQASRILTSELDLEGVEIDNIAEIVKATNTAGRKIYVKVSGSDTGYLGNTTKSPIESINKPGSTTTLVDIAKLESDTDFTEYVTFSPPTGLTGSGAIVKTIAEKTGDILLIAIPTAIIIIGMSYVTVQVIRRKKFYK